MNNTCEMIYVGHSHFSSKDKSKIYYVIQVLYNEEDLTRNTNKATLINIFVDDYIYNKVNKFNIGNVVKVEIKPNMSTGKISYKIVL